MNLGHSISQIMQKASQPFYPIKANLTITSLIETLGFKTSSIDQNQSLRALQTQYKRPLKMNQPRFPHKAKTWEQKSTESGNIFTILNLRGGNIDTGESSFSSS